MRFSEGGGGGGSLKVISSGVAMLVPSQVAQAHYESPEQHYPT